MPVPNVIGKDDEKSRGGSHFAAVICMIAGLLQSGCGLSNGPAQLIVDPDLYNAYHCNDLVNEWNNLNNREKALSTNMSRASLGGGGTVIGTLSYGTDYQTVLTLKKMVQQKAAEKNCEITHNFQSDQTIR